MADEKEILSALLTEVYQIGEDEINSLYEEDMSKLKDDAKTKIFEWDKARVDKLKPNTKDIQENFYKKGASERMSQLEKYVSEKHGFKSDKKGEEFFDEFTDFKIQSASKNGKVEITPEILRSNKFFLDEKEAWEKAKEEEIGTIKKEFESFQQNVNKEKVLFDVIKDADVLFDGFDAILPSDPAKAANQRDTLFRGKLKGFNYRKESDKWIVMDEKGDDLQDGHGNRVSFDKFVKGIFDASFESAAAKQRSTQPKEDTATTKTHQNNSIVDFKKPTTEAEFIDLMKQYEGNHQMTAAINKAYREEMAKVN